MAETKEIKTTTGYRIKSSASSATDEEDQAVVVRMEPQPTGGAGTNTDTPQSNGAITAECPDPAAKPSLVGAMGESGKFGASVESGKVGASGEILNGKEREPISVSSLDTDLSDYYADQSEAAESSSVVDEAGRHRRRRRRKESELQQQQQGRAEKDGETDTQGEEDEDDDTGRKRAGSTITAMTCTSEPLSSKPPPLPLTALQNLHLGNEAPSHSSPVPSYPSVSTPGGETPWEDGNTSTTTTATAADDSSDLESTDGQTPLFNPSGAVKLTTSPNGVTSPYDSK